jgi:kynureninase
VTCRADAEALDGADPIAASRDEFLLPGGVIYHKCSTVT